MIRWVRRRLHSRGDRGAILVIAILIVTVVALVTGVVLTRGDGSLRATVGLRDATRTAYTADAAAQVAINDLRTGANVGNGEPSPWYYTNVSGTGCFGYDGVAPSITAKNELILNGLIPKAGNDTQPTMSARVVCTPDTATGEQGSAVPINNSNKPGYAIVTLNGPLTTADTLKVHGGIYSNSTINGSVAVDAGDVWANGACSQTTVTGTGTKHCNSGQTIADPNYADDLGGTVPALATLPTTCSGGVATFNPGYYDSASALTAATSLCGVSWFKPGTYYFDFHNDSCTNVCPSNVFGTGGNTWNINGGTIVGGTPTDANDNTLTQPPSSPNLPGSCRSPITNVNAVGVQFVFGGSSRMYVDQNSQVELCGTYHVDRPPVVFYGLKSGSTPTSANANGLAATGAITTAGDPTWSGLTSANIQSTGNGNATWAPGSASSKSTTITATGFTPNTALPAGSIVTSATLHVRHQDADATTNSAASATLKVGSTTSAALSLADGTGKGFAAMTMSDVTFNSTTNAGVFNALQTAIHDGTYTGATVAYTAKSKANVSSVLDAITLDLTYYVPVLRGETGTAIATGTGTPILSMKNGNNKILLYLQGTTYAPLAYFDILLGNFAAEVAKFGIVARQLQFAITNGNPDWTGPIFEIPDNSPGFGFETTLVRLEVYVCPAATCNSGGTLSLKTKVKIFDNAGTPGPPNRQMSVLSWSHTR